MAALTINIAGYGHTICISHQSIISVHCNIKHCEFCLTLHMSHIFFSSGDKTDAQVPSYDAEMPHMMRWQWKRQQFCPLLQLFLLPTLMYVIYVVTCIYCAVCSGSRGMVYVYFGNLCDPKCIFHC